MNLKITKEKLGEYKKVEEVIKEAFLNAEYSNQMEAQLVKGLRKTEEFIPKLSIVARVDDKIVGHILYTEINICNGEEKHKALVLAPLAVLPEFQNKGIGSRLIVESLEKAKKLGYKGVIVLGHEHYYKRFGFKSAWIYDIKAPFDVPEDAFMAKELEENYFENISGVVEYAAPFSKY